MSSASAGVPRTRISARRTICAFVRKTASPILPADRVHVERYGVIEKYFLSKTVPGTYPLEDGPNHHVATGVSSQQPMRYRRYRKKAIKDIEAIISNRVAAANSYWPSCVIHRITMPQPGSTESGMQRVNWPSNSFFKGLGRENGCAAAVPDWRRPRQARDERCRRKQAGHRQEKNTSWVPPLHADDWPWSKATKGTASNLYFHMVWA